MREALLLILMVGTFLIMGCVSDDGKYIDPRFDAKAYVQNGDMILEFTKTPKFSAQLRDIEIKKIIDKEAGETEDYTTCPDGQTIHKGRINLGKCAPNEKGNYEIDFKIVHNEGASYKPANSEGCVKYSRGGYECETGGYIPFKVN